jgi:hypothetical protein
LRRGHRQGEGLRGHVPVVGWPEGGLGSIGPVLGPLHALPCLLGPCGAPLHACSGSPWAAWRAVALGEAGLVWGCWRRPLDGPSLSGAAFGVSCVRACIGG